LIRCADRVAVFQAGTEPFTGGETTLTVKNYSANIA